VGGDIGVLKAIDAACADVRQETARRIREAEAWGSSELTRYDGLRQALATGAAIDGAAAGDGTRSETERGASPTSSPTPKKRTRSRRPPKRMSTSPRAVEERRAQIHRYIEESSEPVALRAMAEALGMSKEAARTAILTLESEGLVARNGLSNAIRYTTARRTSSVATKQAPTQGTLAERILAVIADRSHASAEELRQKLGEPIGRIATACGRLEDEGRVRRSNINGRVVFLLARPL
jgi:Mn-dependent DtxR family transcriptional regulator